MRLDGHFLEPMLGSIVPWLYASSFWWTAIGFLGNFLFGSRFFFQWIASEKKRCVVVPAHFWHLSFYGSVLNLFYAFHLDSAPLIFGVAALPIIYGRNLILLRRTHVKEEEGGRISPKPALKPA